MSDETRTWTLEAYKEHVEVCLREKDRALELAREIALARMDALNHFKEESLRKESLFLREDTYEVYHAALQHRVESCEKNLARIMVLGVLAMPAMGLLGIVIGHYWK